jgi:hypothetical protein
MDPREMPEMKVRERPPLMLRNIEDIMEVEDVDDRLPRGAGAEDPRVQRLQSPPLG